MRETDVTEKWRVGMLWRDGSQARLAERIERAGAYYLRKYGQAPNVCFVHPAEFEEFDGSIQVVRSKVVQPGHLWIGVREG